MNPSTTSAPIETTNCNACGHANSGNAKFCAGCGHSLFEPCATCGKDVLLTHKFCGSCGADLESVLNAKRQQFAEWLKKAIETGKKFQFDESLRLLERVTEQKDHRFSDLVAQANQATEKIIAVRDRMVASAEKAMQDAKLAAERDDKSEVVRLLGSVSETLLDAASKDLLSKYKSYQEQKTTLVSALKDAMQDVNYPLACQLLDQLIELSPSEEKYHTLASQLSKKLIKSAERRFSRRDFSGALEKLRSVCRSCADETVDKMLQNTRNVSWMSQLLENEPYVTPSLARFAMRFAKVLRADTEANQLAKSLGESLKRAPKEPRSVFPPRANQRTSWVGGTACHLAFPACIRIEQKSPFRTNVARYNVAIGLALQGLGLGRIQNQFVTKQGIFGGFSKRRSDTCWGIDLGTSGIRAVKLQRNQASRKDDASYSVVQTFLHEFQAPLGHVSMVDRVDESIQEGLQRLKDECDLAGAPVWVNLGGSELISRFLRLPPVKDKQAEQHLSDEIASQIPFPLDELEVVRWMAELGDPKKNSSGRPAIFVASRKHTVERRLKHFSDAEIDVAGLQADPLALTNLASVEFQSLWGPSESSEDGSDDNEPSGTVAIVDCGATTTTLIFVSAQSTWFWTLDAGGEDLTAIIAKSTGKVRDEAEALKRDPAKIASPADCFEPIEERLLQNRSRLQQLKAEAEKQLGKFDVQQSWCVGGGTLALGWIRTVMLDDPEA